MNNPPKPNAVLVSAPEAFRHLKAERAWKTPNGKYLIVGTEEFSVGPVVAVFDATSSQPVIGFMPPIREARDAAMSRDGRYLAFGLGVYDGGAMWEGNLLMWDTQDNRAWLVFDDISGVLACAFDPDTDALTLLCSPVIDIYTNELGFRLVLKPDEWQSTGLIASELPQRERLTDQLFDDATKAQYAGRDYAYYVIEACRAQLPRMEEVDAWGLPIALGGRA